MTQVRDPFSVVVHEAQEGGYWAEVVELPGCVSQGETQDELTTNVNEAIEESVTSLLGLAGIALLDELLMRAKLTAQERNWPLVSSGVRLQSDPEVENIVYVVIVLTIRASAEEADAYLNSFYQVVQEVIDRLPGPTRQILTDNIYFDVEAV